MMPGFLFAAGASAAGAGVLLAESHYLGGLGLVAVAVALVGMRHHIAGRRP